MYIPRRKSSQFSERRGVESLSSDEGTLGVVMTIWGGLGSPLNLVFVTTGLT